MSFIYFFFSKSCGLPSFLNSLILFATKISGKMFDHVTNRQGIRTLNIFVLQIWNCDHTGRSSQKGTEIRLMPRGQATSCGLVCCEYRGFRSLCNLAGQPDFVPDYIQSECPDWYLYRAIKSAHLSIGIIISRFPYKEPWFMLSSFSWIRSLSWTFGLKMDRIIQSCKQKESVALFFKRNIHDIATAFGRRS
jgi:hypothetical protein